MARKKDGKLYIKKSKLQTYCDKYEVLTEKELGDKLWYESGIMLIVEK